MFVAILICFPRVLARRGVEFFPSIMSAARLSFSAVCMSLFCCRYNATCVHFVFDRNFVGCAVVRWSRSRFVFVFPARGTVHLAPNAFSFALI